MIKQIAKETIRFLIVVSGSILVGFSIGVLQHYVAFGVWGAGFGREAFGLALFEGGILGGMLGIPTGLVTYYFCLGGKVKPTQAAVIVGGSLVGGCSSGLILGLGSAILTPLLTVFIAIGVRARESIQSAK